MGSVTRRRGRWGKGSPASDVVPALAFGRCSPVLDVGLSEWLGDDLYDEFVQGCQLLGRLGDSQSDVSDEVPEVLDREGWALCPIRAHLCDEQHELDDAVGLDGAVQAMCAPEGDRVLDDLGA